MTPIRITLISSLALFALACGSSQKAPEATPDPTEPGASDETGDGDTPVSNEPSADGDCATEIAIRCKSPFVDGCDVAHPTDASRKLTNHHRCVSAKPSGTPCEAEIALECGEGAQDGCLLDPPAGDVHFCVAI